MGRGVIIQERIGGRGEVLWAWPCYEKDCISCK